MHNQNNNKNNMTNDLNLIENMEIETSAPEDTTPLSIFKNKKVAQEFQRVKQHFGNVDVDNDRYLYGYELFNEQNQTEDSADNSKKGEQLIYGNRLPNRDEYNKKNVYLNCDHVYGTNKKNEGQKIIFMDETEDYNRHTKRVGRPKGSRNKKPNLYDQNNISEKSQNLKINIKNTDVKILNNIKDNYEVIQSPYKTNKRMSDEIRTTKKKENNNKVNKDGKNKKEFKKTEKEQIINQTRTHHENNNNDIDFYTNTAETPQNYLNGTTPKLISKNAPNIINENVPMQKAFIENNFYDKAEHEHLYSLRNEINYRNAYMHNIQENIKKTNENRFENKINAKYTLNNNTQNENVIFNQNNQLRQNFHGKNNYQPYDNHYNQNMVRNNNIGQNIHFQQTPNNFLYKNTNMNRQSMNVINFAKPPVISHINEKNISNNSLYNNPRFNNNYNSCVYNFNNQNPMANDGFVPKTSSFVSNHFQQKNKENMNTVSVQDPINMNQKRLNEAILYNNRQHLINTPEFANKIHENYPHAFKTDTIYDDKKLKYFNQSISPNAPCKDGFNVLEFGKRIIIAEKINLPHLYSFKSTLVDFKAYLYAFNSYLGLKMPRYEFLVVLKDMLTYSLRNNGFLEIKNLQTFSKLLKNESKTYKEMYLLCVYPLEQYLLRKKLIELFDKKFAQQNEKDNPHNLNIIDVEKICITLKLGSTKETLNILKWMKDRNNEKKLIETVILIYLEINQKYIDKIESNKKLKNYNNNYKCSVCSKLVVILNMNDGEKIKNTIHKKILCNECSHRNYDKEYKNSKTPLQDNIAVGGQNARHTIGVKNNFNVRKFCILTVEQLFIVRELCLDVICKYIAEFNFKNYPIVEYLKKLKDKKTNLEEFNFHIRFLDLQKMINTLIERIITENNLNIIIEEKSINNPKIRIINFIEKFYFLFDLEHKFYKKIKFIIKSVDLCKILGYIFMAKMSKNVKRKIIKIHDKSIRCELNLILTNKTNEKPYLQKLNMLIRFLYDIKSYKVWIKKILINLSHIFANEADRITKNILLDIFNFVCQRMNNNETIELINYLNKKKNFEMQRFVTKFLVESNECIK
ncbi:hypothetical protein COBT_000435 [Conglomerata obtusa]